MIRKNSMRPIPLSPVFGGEGGVRGGFARERAISELAPHPNPLPRLWGRGSRRVTSLQAVPALFVAILVATVLQRPNRAMGADAYVPFDGAKTSWHGFDRYDFLMDDQSLEIKPHVAAPEERDGIKGEVKGQRRCVVVVPKDVAPGAPWSWRGCYWDHQPQTEVELLKLWVSHRIYLSRDANLKPGKEWDAWYAFLTEKHGLSKKPAFIGMSRGGEYEFTWATLNPDKVSCIYADNPGSNPGVFMRLGDLARADVPVIEVCGSIDPLLGKNALAIEAMYQQYGGRISMMIKEGAGHHPHSLHDPKPLADFIVQSVQATRGAPPAFAGHNFTRNSFYGIESDYRDFPGEGTHITCRGPFFADCYDRYAFNLPGVEGTITVIEPKTAAAGKPWVFRSDFVNRDDVVDLAACSRMDFTSSPGPFPITTMAHRGRIGILSTSIWSITDSQRSR